MDRPGHRRHCCSSPWASTVRPAVAHPTEFTDNVKLRIMQPNLAQDVRFNYPPNGVMQKYLHCSTAPPDHIRRRQRRNPSDLAGIGVPIFPLPRSRRDGGNRRSLTEGTILITGSVRAPDLPPDVKITQAYYSIYVITIDGSILSIYDKLHLVPFGGNSCRSKARMEKLGFVQLTKVRRFHSGTAATDHRTANAPSVLPLICSTKRSFRVNSAARAADRAGS